MPAKPIELTEAEWTIIKAVWDREPCTAPAIQEQLFKRTAWTCSTVRTLMDRRANPMTRYGCALVSLGLMVMAGIVT